MYNFIEMFIRKIEIRTGFSNAFLMSLKNDLLVVLSFINFKAQKKYHLNSILVNYKKDFFSIIDDITYRLLKTSVK